ncbi:hypothetical protein WICMUC_000713 [Wickerhamomyces mucosus]|uniref:BHLH domain-containing protein n=1 Tax=Wickerhamomyces mucosus TaxID=1378264 RepID=A0A9P8TIK6_9ASCO|nr:hypothetical protein WICMUC_000713 [Wickerhamomyces mucosus]
MGEEFWNFDNNNVNLDDFNFNISSAIPEHELLEFTNPQALTTENYSSTSNNNFSNNTENDEFINSLKQSSNEFTPQSLSHLNPSQILEQRSVNVNNNASSFNDGTSFNNSFHNSYVSPINSPYSNTQHLSTSINNKNFQRVNSIYDENTSAASPQTNINGVLQSQYFSPVSANPYLKTSSSLQQQFKSNSRNASISQQTENSIASPIGSFNDALSPYSFNDSSFKSPRSYGVSPGGASLPKNQLSKEEKLKRRREFHNQVERRRRDLIKEKIKELGLIVPPSLLSSDGEGKEVKASKSVIINKTVEYAIHLNKVMAEQNRRRELLISKIQELEQLPDVHEQEQSSSSSNNGTPTVNAQTRTQNPQRTNRDTFSSTESYNSSIPAIKLESDFGEELGFDINDFLKDQTHQNNWEGLQ